MDGEQASPRQRRRLHLSLRQLQAVYHLPLKQAAQRLGVCEAALKRICRRHGILKWPYRQLSSVERRIADLRATRSEPSGKENDAGRQWGNESLLEGCTSRLHCITLDYPERGGASSAMFKSKTVKLQALIDEHRRIIHTAHLEQDNTAPFTTAPRSSSQHRGLTVRANVRTPPPSLLALASACEEVHTAARQRRHRPQHKCSYQTARMLDLVPPHNALHALAAVASRVPHAAQPNE